MKRETFFIALLPVAVVLLAISVGRDVAAMRHATAMQAALETKRAGAPAELRRIAQRRAEAEREIVARQQALAEWRAKNSGPVMAKPSPTKRSLNILEVIRNEPDAEAFFLATRRSELAAKYGPLFRTLGLSAEAVAKFQDIYIKREEARMDLEDVLRTTGAEESGAAVAKLRAAAEAEYAAAQRALLGDAGIQKLEDYERYPWLRAMVSAIAGVAAVEHVPFSAAQADALVQAVSETNRRAQNGGYSLAGVDWAAVDARAQSILSADQLAIFRTMDPGPTRGGLAQIRMYALVELANEEDKKKAGNVVAPPGG